jgi:hypothetical protein
VSPAIPLRSWSACPAWWRRRSFLDTPRPPASISPPPGTDHDDALRDRSSGCSRTTAIHAARTTSTSPRRPPPPRRARSDPRVPGRRRRVQRRESRASARSGCGRRKGRPGSATEPDTRPAMPGRPPGPRCRRPSRWIPDFRFGLEGIVRLDLFGHQALVLLVDATDRAESESPARELRCWTGRWRRRRPSRRCTRCAGPGTPEPPRPSARGAGPMNFSTSWTTRRGSTGLAR